MDPSSSSPTVGRHGSSSSTLTSPPPTALHSDLPTCYPCTSHCASSTFSSSHRPRALPQLLSTLSTAHCPCSLPSSTMALQPKIRPKTQRSKRALEARAPRLVEGPRHCLVLRGSKTSALTLSLLRSLHIVQQPYSVALQRHHSLHPFDDATSLEFLLSKADASTFVLGSHSKKRPNNLVLGRTFDYQLLDMVEYGVVDASYEGVEAFEGVRKAIVRLGSKPALVFQGELWDSGDDWAVQRSLWLDLLKADDLSRINLSALDRVFVLSALPPDRVELRHFAIRMRPSTSKLPYVELDEMGPRVSLTFRRRLQASADLVKASLVQPKSAGRKNVSRSDAGDRVGRVHMARQDLSNVAIAKLKGLKRKRGHGMGEEDDAGGGQGAGGGTDGADGAGAAAKKRRGVSGAGGYGPNRAPAPAVQAKTPARSGSNR